MDRNITVLFRTVLLIRFPFGGDTIFLLVLIDGKGKRSKSITLLLILGAVSDSPLLLILPFQIPREAKITRNLRRLEEFFLPVCVKKKAERRGKISGNKFRSISLYISWISRNNGEREGRKEEKKERRVARESCCLNHDYRAFRSSQRPKKERKSEIISSFSTSFHLHLNSFHSSRSSSSSFADDRFLFFPSGTTLDAQPFCGREKKLTLPSPPLHVGSGGNWKR